ncbi:hypothetical protein TNCV_2197541 [Trichonephila clavipes]|nr:hypothetical protein TNCV_2197541 [Trichonephila clavipes]
MASLNLSSAQATVGTSQDGTFRLPTLRPGKARNSGQCIEFSRTRSNEGDDFPSHIVTADETWVAYVTPASKQQSSSAIPIMTKRKRLKQWLSNQAASFFDDGIQKLVPRYDKCLNSNGNYVEK